jgi:hypothetical protein
MRVKIWIAGLIAGLAMASFTCKEEPVAPPTLTDIHFEVIDQTCTSLDIKIKFSDTARVHSFILLRDETPILSTKIEASDTIVSDMKLTPGKMYEYYVRPSDNRLVSDRLRAKTLDTTSHEFVWQIDTLGDGASSVLYDVAIINDTCVWAVGEYYLRDSLGAFDPQRYGAAIWNGKRWTMKKVPAHDYGSTKLYPAEVITVWGFSPTSIYVATSANLLKWDGTQWTEKAFFMKDLSFNGQVRKMWASSESNIYFAGNNGAIFHYDGKNWQTIESGTTLMLKDIYGGYNTRTGQWEVLAVGNSDMQSYERIILNISGLTANKMSDTGIDWPLSGVWFLPGRHYYCVGAGIYEKDRLSDPRWTNDPQVISHYYTYRATGIDINDVFVVGSYGEIVHCNGMSWKSSIKQTGLRIGEYYGIAVSGDYIFAVGDEYPRAIIARGKRVR